MIGIDEDDCAAYGVCAHTIGVVYDTQLYSGGAIGDLESDGEFDENFDMGDESSPTDKEEPESESEEEKSKKKSAKEDDDGPFIVARAKEPAKSIQSKKRTKKHGKKEESAQSASGGAQMKAFTAIVRDFDDFLKHARLPM